MADAGGAYLPQDPDPPGGAALLAAAVVRYTVMALPADPAAVLRPLRRRRERRPNGTYDFRAPEVAEALEPVAAGEQWERPPATGEAVIRTWHNRHPRTLLRWLREQVGGGLSQRVRVVEVPADAPPTWMDAAERLVDARRFLRVCPTGCSRPPPLSRHCFGSGHGRGGRWCPGGGSAGAHAWRAGMT